MTTKYLSNNMNARSTIIHVQKVIRAAVKNTIRQGPFYLSSPSNIQLNTSIQFALRHLICSNIIADGKCINFEIIDKTSKIYQIDAQSADDIKPGDQYYEFGVPLGIVIAIDENKKASILLSTSPKKSYDVECTIKFRPPRAINFIECQMKIGM